MHEILRAMGAGCRVLDLGCKEGSFGIECCPDAQIVRLDRLFTTTGADFVQADAARLPFRNGTFDAVIANHCLEHMDDADGVLREIGRVARRGGALYIAVPDGSSLTDRIYRWIYHGGEHVNLFRSAEDLASRITAATGLELGATRVLHTSLFFLNGALFKPRPPRRLWLFANGDPRLIACLTYVLRLADRLLGVRLSVYGWAMYFGCLREPVETAAWTNVCVGCGVGRSAAALISKGLVRRRLFLPASYSCPTCRTWNLFTWD